jgi:hypothetical protein
VIKHANGCCVELADTRPLVQGISVLMLVCTTAATASSAWGSLPISSAMCMYICAGAPTSCLLTEARVLSIATVFGLTIGILVYASASFSGAAPTATQQLLHVCFWLQMRDSLVTGKSRTERSLLIAPVVPKFNEVQLVVRQSCHLTSGGAAACWDCRMLHKQP